MKGLRDSSFTTKVNDRHFYKVGLSPTQDRSKSKSSDTWTIGMWRSSIGGSSSELWLFLRPGSSSFSFHSQSIFCTAFSDSASLWCRRTICSWEKDKHIKTCSSIFRKSVIRKRREYKLPFFRCRCHFVVGWKVWLNSVAHGNEATAADLTKRSSVQSKLETNDNSQHLDDPPQQPHQEVQTLSKPWSSPTCRRHLEARTRRVFRCNGNECHGFSPPAKKYKSKV